MTCNYKPINYTFTVNCPQYTAASESYTLDFDGDLNSDLNVSSSCKWLYFSSLPGWVNSKEILLTPTYTNCQLVSDGMGGIKNVAYGTILNNSLTWMYTSGYLYGTFTNPYYVCLRKILSGDTINCWISINFSNFPGGINSCAYKRTSDTLMPQSTTITSLPASICKGDSLSLMANPIGGNFYGSGVTGNFFKSKNLAAGVYTVCYAIPNSTACTTSPSSATVMVNSLPTVFFNGSPSVICINDTTTLNVSPIGGSFNYSGNGLVGNTLIASQAGVGTHTVSYSYTNTAGCSSTASKIITVSACVGINEIDNLNSLISVYPNPAASKLFVETENELSSEIVLNLINIDGRKIKSLRLANKKQEIDVNELSAGIYFVEIVMEKHVLKKKIVITR